MVAGSDCSKAMVAGQRLTGGRITLPDDSLGSEVQVPSIEDLLVLLLLGRPANHPSAQHPAIGVAMRRRTHRSSSALWRVTAMVTSIRRPSISRPP